MKKIISILLLATFCIFTQLHAQNRADELMKQAQENLTKKNISKPAIYSCKPTMPLPRKTSMPRQWNAASMPAPSTIGRITIKKLLNCCAVPSKWWQPANRKRARPCPTYVSASTRNACRCTST